MNNTTPEPRDLGAMRRWELTGGLIYWALLATGLAYWPARLLTRVLYGTTESDNGFLALNLLIYATHVLVLGLLLRRFWLGQLRRFRSRGLRALADLALGFALYYGGLLILDLILAELLPRIPEYGNANQEAVEEIFRLSPFWSGIMACVLAPLAEETLYRGLFFRTLLPKSRLLAYGLSMLLFAGAHVWSHVLNQSLAVTAVNLVIYMLPGFCLAWVYERSGSLLTSVLLHSVINSFLLLLQP